MLKTMKQLLILFLVFSAIQENAQWYTKQFGVNDINELNKEQLNIAYENSNYREITGIICTTSGIILSLIGIVGFIKAPNNEDWLYEKELDQFVAGLFTFPGVVLTAVGIPLTTIGISRRKIIKVQLAKFNDTSYTA
jgi:hypothetical protein